ncbi:hypothetical protein YN1HA_19460 [Sulfurisphaera ohwakuensis]
MYSSAMISLGLVANALAIVTLYCCPPDICVGLLFLNS